MKSPLYLLPVVLLLPLGGCSSDSKARGPDPLATVSGFCQAWAELACTQKVVDLCAADDINACQSGQAGFCESIVPGSGYDPKYAKECLRAVERAYSGTGLTAEQLLVVRQLGGDCSRLIRGASSVGDACSKDTDCDTIAGYLCVTRPAGEGTCQIPEEVEPGRSCENAAAVCQEDFYCDGSHCLEKLAEDEACIDTQECAADLRCQGADTGEGGASGAGDEGGTCVPRITGLGTCESNDDCASGFCEQSGEAAGECFTALQFGRNESICKDLR